MLNRRGRGHGGQGAIYNGMTRKTGREPWGSLGKRFSGRGKGESKAFEATSPDVLEEQQAPAWLEQSRRGLGETRRQGAGVGWAGSCIAMALAFTLGWGPLQGFEQREDGCDLT